MAFGGALWESRQEAADWMVSPPASSPPAPGLVARLAALRALRATFAEEPEWRRSSSGR